MKRTNCKFAYVFFVIAVLTAFLVVSSFGFANKPEKPTIKIGRILPLTGPAASYGQSEKRGSDLAIEEINRAGGIQGAKLQVLYEDSTCSSREGVSAMKKLVNVEKVPLVLGATCSTVTLAIAPIANANKVVLLSPLSSAAKISEAGPYIFRVMPSDAFQSTVLAKWIYELGYKKVAILFINNAWGLGVKDAFVVAFRKLNGNIVGEEACNEGANDFRTQLSKLIAAQPDAFFFPTMPKEGGKILRQAKEHGLKAPIFGADAWSVRELLDAAGETANGVLYTMPAQYEGPEYQDFSRKFEARYGEKPDVNAAGAYDAVKIAALTMERVLKNGLHLTGENIKNEMAKIKGYKGATGDTTFDGNGDPVGKKFSKMAIRDGRRVPVQ
ncbi:MAG: ABC transporter substrate-binding protein [Proteobacteria bacterium]|nr:ABC transporter substrate-binding protein [Pseudomonadota bacterium]MBU4288094.1 ABC transporter substrate-binding protein [Pseudomonadota bacterium]MCG2829858.1 ABC transporter substrate-binding protein [Desulfobacteraceae bacterium]